MFPPQGYVPQATATVRGSVKQAAADADTVDNSGGASGGGTIAAIPNPGDAPASVDALRDDLVANTIPALKNAIATLAAELNDLKAKQRTAGQLAT